MGQKQWFYYSEGPTYWHCFLYHQGVPHGWSWPRQMALVHCTMEKTPGLGNPTILVAVLYHAVCPRGRLKKSSAANATVSNVANITVRAVRVLHPWHSQAHSGSRAENLSWQSPESCSLGPSGSFYSHSCVCFIAFGICPKFYWSLQELRLAALPL